MRIRQLGAGRTGPAICDKRSTPGWSAFAAQRIPLLLAAALLVGAAPAQALVIDPTFDSSITSSANAAAIETAINSALAFYSVFTNPVTARIDFQLAPSGSYFLGASLSTYYLASYASYTTALQTNATSYSNSVELSGYRHLGTGNNAQQILATSADYRALNANLPGILTTAGNYGGTFDGIVYLNAADLSGFGHGGTFSAIPTIQHETNEVLGIGGSGSVLNTMEPLGLTAPPIYNGQSAIGPLDLYRYSAPGTASLSTDPYIVSYFSINGGASSIIGFNQCAQGDYGDWVSNGNSCGTSVGATPPQVQLAFTGPNSPATMTLAAPEVTALQAIGYDLAVSVPEPAPAALFAAGLIALAIATKRRRASH